MCNNILTCISIRIVNTGILAVAKMPAYPLWLFIIVMPGQCTEVCSKRITCCRNSFKVCLATIRSFSYLDRFAFVGFTTTNVEDIHTYFVQAVVLIIVYNNILTCICIRIVNTGILSITKVPAYPLWFFIIVVPG